MPPRLQDQSDDSPCKQLPWVQCRSSLNFTWFHRECDSTIQFTAVKNWELAPLQLSVRYRCLFFKRSQQAGPIAEHSCDRKRLSYPGVSSAIDHFSYKTSEEPCSWSLAVSKDAFGLLTATDYRPTTNYGGEIWKQEREPSPSPKPTITSTCAQFPLQQDSWFNCFL